jgi:uncharacterized repeat protein (TIGR02543 family)
LQKGRFQMKFLKILTLIILIGLITLALISCEDPEEPESQVYYISFDTNGGSGDFHTVPTRGNTTFAMPTLPPVREGYTFDGWFFDLNRWERQLTATSLLLNPITANCTVYAKWTYKTPSQPNVDDPTLPLLRFELTLVSDGHENVTKNISRTAIEATDVAGFEKSGYLLTGWYLNSQFQGDPISFPFDNNGSSGVITLYAKWSIITYPVSYVVGTSNADVIKLPPQEQRSIGEVFYLPDLPTSFASYTGHIFTGWTLGSNPTEFSAGDSYVFYDVPTAGSITFVASWTRTYDAIFGTAAGDNVYGAPIPSISRIAGASYYLPTKEALTIFWDYHVFSGWYDGQNTYLPTNDNPVQLTMPAYNINYTALWKPLYNVTYTIADGMYGSVSGGQYVAGDTFVLPDASNLTTAGYEFKGWKLDSQEYAAGYVFTMPDESINFSAVVDVQARYTVSFSAETATGSTPSVSDKLANETFVIPDNPPDFMREYYAFDHWTYRLNNAVEDSIVYTGGTITMPSENLTLTAAWRPLNYTVTYDYGTSPIIYSPVNNENPTTYNAGISENIPIEDISALGYNFEGWYRDSARTSKYDNPQLDVSKPTSIVFYAKFSFITYKVFLSDGITTDNSYINTADNIKTDGNKKYIEIRYGDPISSIIENISVFYESYILAYWDLKGLVYTPTSTWGYAGDIELTAIWTKPGSTGLIFIISSDGKSMSVKGYNGSESIITIPSYQNQLPVTSIDVDAFKRDTVVTQIIIPSTITEIASGAFEESVLCELTLGSGITTIASGAFKNAKALRGVFAGVNLGISTIGANAFEGCSDLKYVYLPASLLSIGANAFLNISNDAIIYMSGIGAQSGFASDWSATASVVWNARVDSATDLVYKIEDSSASIIGYVGTSSELDIDSKINNTTISKISSFAFANNRLLEKISIASQLSVEDNAFENCPSLHTVIFKTAPSYISMSAFYNSDSVVVYVIGNYNGAQPTKFYYNNVSNESNIILSNDIYFLNDGSNNYIITKYAGIATDFHSNNQSINYTYTGFGDGAFAGSSVTDLYLYDTKTIGGFLFYGCTSDATINIMNAVTLDTWNSLWNITDTSSMVSIEFPNRNLNKHPSLAIDYYEIDNNIYIVGYTGSDTDFSITVDMVASKTIKAVINAFNVVNAQSASFQYLFVGDNIALINSFKWHNELVVAASNNSQAAYFIDKSLSVSVQSTQPTKYTYDNVNYYYTLSGELLRAVTTRNILVLPDNTTGFTISSVSEQAFNTFSIMRLTIDRYTPISISSEAFSSNNALIIYFNGNVSFSGHAPANAYSTNLDSTDSFYYFTKGSDYVLVDYQGSNSQPSIPDNITIIASGAFKRTTTTITAIEVPWKVHTFPQDAVDVSVTLQAYSQTPGWELSNKITTRTDDFVITNTFNYYSIDSSSAIIVGASSTYVANANGSLTIPSSINSRNVIGIIDPLGSSISKINTLIIQPTSGYFIGLLNSLAQDAVVLFKSSDSSYTLYNQAPKTSNLFFSLEYKEKDTGISGYYSNDDKLKVLSKVTTPASDSYKLSLENTTELILPNAFSDTNINILLISAGCKISKEAFNLSYVGMRILVEDDLDTSYSQLFPDSIIYTNVKESDILEFNNFYYIVNHGIITIIGLNSASLITDVTTIEIPLSMPLSAGSIEYVPLTAIDNYAFDALSANSPIRVITIPSIITHIYKNSFSNIDTDIANTAEKVKLQLQGGVLSTWESGWNAGLQFETYTGMQSDDDNFKFFVSGGQAYITSYIGNATSVTIPVSFANPADENNPFQVVSIGSMFAGSKTLTSLTINATITEFADAIQGCTSLTSITLPASITKIPDYAFANLSALDTITFIQSGQQLTIGKYAFANLIKLTSIILPSISSLGEYAFSGCRSLSAFTSQIPDNKIPKGLFYNCINLQFNLANIVEIGDYAFYRNLKLTTITIPASLKSIGVFAFADISTLLSISFNNNTYLTSVSAGLFADATSLREVTLTHYIKTIEAGAFKNAVNLARVNAMESVESISGSAFEECTSLSLTIPGNITNIGARAFFRVMYIGEATLDSVKSIGVAAFAYAGVTRFSISNSLYYSVANDILYSNNTLLQYPILKVDNELSLDNLLAIAPYAFAGASSLLKITIKEVTAIGEYAFASNPYLTIYVDYSSKPSGWSNSWSETNAVWKNSSEIIFDSDFAYVLNSDNTYTLVGYSGKNYLTIPNSYSGKLITAIGEYAFANKNMAWIKIDGNITSIASTAFDNNKGLTVWYADDYTVQYDKTSDHEWYKGYSALTMVEETSSSNYTYYYFNVDMAARRMVKLTTDETYIDLTGAGYSFEMAPYVFSGTPLRAISLPTITKISNLAFAETPNLVITIASDKTINWENGFDDNVAVHQNITPNKETSYLYYEDGENYYILKYLGTNAILDLSLESVTKTKIIAPYAFAGVESLTTISVTDFNIEKYAFSNMQNLESFKLTVSNYNPATIGEYAFSNSSRLATFSIEDSDQYSAFKKVSASQFIFNGCLSLISITTEADGTKDWPSLWDRIKMQSASTPVLVMVIS